MGAHQSIGAIPIRPKFSQQVRSEIRVRHSNVGCEAGWSLAGIFRARLLATLLKQEVITNDYFLLWNLSRQALLISYPGTPAGGKERKKRGPHGPPLRGNESPMEIKKNP